MLTVMIVNFINDQANEGSDYAVSAYEGSI